jgi:hypothetical protein
MNESGASLWTGAEWCGVSIKGKKQWDVEVRASNSPRRKHSASRMWPEVMLEISAPKTA